MFSRHLPQDCAAFNEKARKVMTDYLKARENIAKKYGLNLIFSGGFRTEHQRLEIWDVPTVDTFLQACMEPEYFALLQFETYEVKVGERESTVDLAKLLKMADATMAK